MDVLEHPMRQDVPRKLRRARVAGKREGAPVIERRRHRCRLRIVEEAAGRLAVGGAVDAGLQAPRCLAGHAVARMGEQSPVDV
jgi:hypothetical protein